MTATTLAPSRRRQAPTGSNPSKKAQVARRRSPAETPSRLYCQFGHSFVRHAVEHGSADQALHSTIEALLEAADRVAIERSLTAEALAAFDDDLLQPIIRRGQTQGIWSRAAPAARLALALRSLIAGLHAIGIRSHQDRPALIRQIEILFSEAAENAS